MPTVVRVTLPVTDLPQAVQFYRALLGDDGEALGSALHVFFLNGVSLVLRESVTADSHAGAVSLALNEPLDQVRYRVQSLGARAIDHEPRTFETGEQGLELHDPFGNVLYLLDPLSATGQWRVATAVAAPAPVEPESSITLQRDFINAVKGGDLEAVEDLLALDGELVDATDSMGVSALMHAAYKGHRAVAEFLLQRSSDLTLWEAAALGQRERLASLLDRGFRPNVFSADGFTPLGLASFFGHADCVKLLLQRGANVHAVSQNHLHVQPLHSALSRARPEAVLDNVTALVGAGADVNARQQGGYTPLHQAADRGLTQVIATLIKAGAQRAVLSENGRKPLDLARARGHADAARLLGQSLS